MIMRIKHLLPVAAFLFTASLNVSASSDIVAKYNGKDIHKAEIEKKLRILFQGSLPEGKKNFDALNKEIKQRLVAEIVQQKTLEDEIAKSSIKDNDLYKQQVAEIEKEIAINVFLDHYAKRKVTDQMLNAEYSNYIKTLKENDELKVSHVIVNDENKAKDLLKQINNKAITFEEAAKQNNIDATRAQSGEIGYISKGKTVPEFEQAAYSAKKNNVVGPIKTDFGWHLIKVTDSRKQKVPKFEEIKPQLAQQVSAKVKQQYVIDVMKNANIQTFVE